MSRYPIKICDSSKSNLIGSLRKTSLSVQGSLIFTMNNHCAMLLTLLFYSISVLLLSTTAASYTTAAGPKKRYVSLRPSIFTHVATAIQDHADLMLNRENPQYQVIINAPDDHIFKELPYSIDHAFDHIHELSDLCKFLIRQSDSSRKILWMSLHARFGAVYYGLGHLMSQNPNKDQRWEFAPNDQHQIIYNNLRETLKKRMQEYSNALQTDRGLKMNTVQLSSVEKVEGDYRKFVHSTHNMNIYDFDHLRVPISEELSEMECPIRMAKLGDEEADWDHAICLPCGHCFCPDELEETMLYKAKCSICRADALPGLIHNGTFDHTHNYY